MLKIRAEAFIVGLFNLILFEKNIIDTINANAATYTSTLVKHKILPGFTINLTINSVVKTRPGTL